MLDLGAVRALADVTREQARALGEKTALVFEGRRTSYAALDAAADRVAAQLVAAGVKPHERVAILAKNCDRFYEIWFGAMKARVCLAPVNFRLAAPEIAYILKDSAAKILFVGPDFADLAERALADLTEKPRVIALGDGAYEDWRDAGGAAPAFAPQDDDDIVQLYTSGTTGNPKGVQLTNQNYVEGFLRRSGRVEGFDYRAEDAVLNAMPLFHVAGVNIGLAGLANGSTVVIIKDIVPGPVLELIARERISHAFFAPAIILMLMNCPEMAGADLTSMKTVSYGASPITEDLLVRARARFGCNFLQFYGMTETAGAGTFLPAQDHDPARGKLRSCGVPWPDTEVRVVDAAGAEVPVGDVGEIVIRAPFVMKGYYNRPDATAESVQDGWMRTGDAAFRDADGYFYIHDRVKDMIVTGGENVYPAEVENALAGHPAIADVAVIGVPDEKWGEAVKAIIVLKPGAAPDIASIVAHARERVAAYKAPKSIDFVETIPRNPSGKILRRELRQPYWEGRERMVG